MTYFLEKSAPSSSIFPMLLRPCDLTYEQVVEALDQKQEVKLKCIDDLQFVSKESEDEFVMRLAIAGIKYQFIVETVSVGKGRTFMSYVTKITDLKTSRCWNFPLPT